VGRGGGGVAAVWSAGASQGRGDWGDTRHDGGAVHAAGWLQAAHVETHTRHAVIDINPPW